YAFGINNKGEVVGESSAPNAGPNGYWWSTHAFLYKGGAMQDVGTLGGYYARAVAVNNHTQVVGYGPTANNDQTHAFSWLNGTLTDLGAYPGGTYSQATSVNDHVQIVGLSSAAQTDLVGSLPPPATC